MIENAEIIVRWAMEIADSVPERYQEAAFTELLRCALESSTASVPKKPIVEEPSLDSGKSLSERVVATTPDEYLIATKGSREQQTVWAVIELCQQGIEAISSSVSNLIKTRLSIQPESRPNTSHRLGALTPKYLMREDRKEGQGYAYRPTLRANEIFEGLEE